MNEALIDNWNSVVKKNDKVYHLGDVAFGKHNLHYLDRCNGNKVLIMGNHDTYDVLEFSNYFSKIF